jgi:hypothetical protein
MRNGLSRVPYGELLSELILDLEESDEDWEQLRELVEGSREDTRQLRRNRDRDRKRRSEGQSGNSGLSPVDDISNR